MVLFVWDSRRGAECRNIQELQQTAAGSQTCMYVLVIENTATPVNILTPVPPHSSTSSVQLVDRHKHPHEAVRVWKQ